MRSRTRMVAAVAVTAALAAGSTAAAASTAGAKPHAAAKTTLASQKPGGAKVAGSSAAQRPGQAVFVAAVAGQLHVSAARVSAALEPLFAAGRADPSSPVFAAAARSLGVSVQRLTTAIVQAKESLAGTTYARQSQARTKVAGSSAAQRPGEAVFVAAVAGQLHVSAARVSAALEPLFAAGRADPSSPVFAAAARSLGVGVQQLSAALVHAKESLAGPRS